MTTSGGTGPYAREADGVLQIILAPHSVRNALSAQACRDLMQLFELEPPADRRCYFIAGEGEAFCSGADTRDLTSYEDATRFESAMGGLFLRMREQPLPIVCWINGAAIGGGAVLALLCDIRLASPSTRIVMPAMRRGIALEPDLVRIIDEHVGRAAATQLLIMGRDASGPDLPPGIAHGVAADLAEALAVARSLVDLGGPAVAAHRRVLQGDMVAARKLYQEAQDGPARASTLAAFGRRSGDLGTSSGVTPPHVDG